MPPRPIAALQAPKGGFVADPVQIPGGPQQGPTDGGWPSGGGNGGPASQPLWGTTTPSVCFPTGPGRFPLTQVGRECPVPAAIPWWPSWAPDVDSAGSEMAERGAELNPGFGPAWRLACQLFTHPDSWVSNLGGAPEDHPEWESRLSARFRSHGHLDTGNWRLFGNFAVKVEGHHSLVEVLYGDLLVDPDFMLNLSLLLRLTRLCVLEAADYFAWIPRNSAGAAPRGAFNVADDFFEALRQMATEDVVFLSFSEGTSWSAWNMNGRSDIRLNVLDLRIRPGEGALADFRYYPPNCYTDGGSAPLGDALLGITSDVSLIVHELCHGVWLANFGLPSGATNQYEGPDFRTFTSYLLPKSASALPWFWQHRRNVAQKNPGQPAPPDSLFTRLIGLPSQPFSGGQSGHPNDLAFNSRHWVCEWVGSAVGGWGLGAQFGAAYMLEKAHLNACRDSAVGHGGVLGYRPKTTGDTLLGRPGC